MLINPSWVSILTNLSVLLIFKKNSFYHDYNVLLIKEFVGKSFVFDIKVSNAS